MCNKETYVVYVLAKDGKPLMPTKRFGHVRRLLKAGKAKPVRGNGPFTIQLTYDTTHYTQPVTVGIDPGQTNIGIAAVTNNGTCLFAGHLTTRNTEIPKLMRKRKAFRMARRKHLRREKRQRRAKSKGTACKEPMQRILPQCKEPIVCKVIRNKQARFCNRKRPDGWLTPTATHLLRTHVNIVRKVAKFLPVTDVSIEANKFAFMELEAGHRLFGNTFCNGLLKRYKDVKGYVSSLQDGKCLLCGKAIEHYHHIVPKRLNGSDTARNIAGLCRGCHSLVHTNATYRQILISKKRGIWKAYAKTGVLNQVIPHMIRELEAMYPEHLHVTDGKATQKTRRAANIGKAHHLDAYVIACNGMNVSPAYAPTWKYELMQFRRHNRQACKKANVARKYYLNGKCVATNRHRAFEQPKEAISLDEYRAAGGRMDKLEVKPHLPIYQRMDRVPRGSLMLVNGRTKVFVASQGMYKGKPYYYSFADGTKAATKECRLLQQNTGIVFVSKTAS